MNEFVYYVYDGGDLLAAFVSLCTTVNFIEGWRGNSSIPMDMVDAHTGEVVDTWVNGKWENGDY